MQRVAQTQVRKCQVRRYSDIVFIDVYYRVSQVILNRDSSSEFRDLQSLGLN